jgi:cyclopropane fatty-acyl-phospholipid synthase-like methyltransferase
VKKKYEEKTEGVLSIIKSCESLRESYRNTQHNWIRSIEKEQDGIEETHKSLERQTYQKKLLILRPQDHNMIRRVLPEYAQSN